MPFRLLAPPFAALILVLVAGTAQAQSRDQALDAVKGIAERLIIRVETGQASEKQIWAGVQAVTDALHRFVLAETEIRADDKVGPPEVAALRPGQSEAAPADTAPGTEADMADVPTDWFNAQATRAQTALESVRGALEKAAPPAEITAGMRRVLRALGDMNRPSA